MLLPERATASSRPDLHVLAISAVFNLAVRSASFVCCMQEERFVMNDFGGLISG